MKRLFFALVVTLPALLVSGCITTQGTAVKAAFEQGVEVAAKVADEAMDATIELLCSKRFSLRGYEAFLRRHGWTWDDLSNVCGVDLGSPPEPEPLLDGTP